MKQLKLSLLVNAVFSLASGISLIFFSKETALFLPIESDTPIQIIGALLFAFSITVFYESKRKNPLGVLCIIIQDLLWVLASLIILIINPFHISSQGNYAITLVALIVLLISFNQSRALAQTDSSISDKKMKILTFNRTVKGTKEKCWEIISDVGNFHKVAPNLTNVKILSEEKKGVGMIRSCSHEKETWTETCSNWEPGSEYAFIVNTKEPDYPYPLKYLKGIFKVEEIDSTNSEISMKYEFIFKRSIYNILLYPIMKPKFKKTCEKILDNWQRMIENNLWKN